MLRTFSSFVFDAALASETEEEESLGEIVEVFLNFSKFGFAFRV